MVLQYCYCEKCDEYPNIFKRCRSYQTSGNKQIDDFIQEKKLSTNWSNHDIGFEWISYNQLSYIKEIGKDAKTYSATWIDGPLYYDNMEWIRKSDTKVILKCLYNSPDIIDKFLNEVCTIL